MPGLFEPQPGAAAVRLTEAEISILRSQAVQLLRLIGPAEEPNGADAGDLLASALADGPSEPPADPALARLFPDAYGDPHLDPDDDVRAASAEFRRFTENDLRARKRHDAVALIRSLDTLTPAGHDSTVLRLKHDECHQWLGALNDLRLAIGTRLELTDEDDADELLHLPDTDPRQPMAMVYLWLSGLQETLVESLPA